MEQYLTAKEDATMHQCNELGCKKIAMWQINQGPYEENYFCNDHVESYEYEYKIQLSDRNCYIHECLDKAVYVDGITEDNLITLCSYHYSELYRISPFTFVLPKGTDVTWDLDKED